MSTLQLTYPTSRSFLCRRALAGFFGLWFLFLSASTVVASALPVTFKGANGRMVDFVGIREANQRGMFMMVTREQGEMLVPWELFDIDDLQVRHPDIFAIYQDQRQGGKQPAVLRRGVYESIRPLRQFVTEMAEAANSKVSMPVPNMAEMYDMSRFDQRYSRSLRGAYTTWSRRSETFVREYERWVQEFFRLETPESNRSSWRLFSGGTNNVVYTVYTDVGPSSAKVDMGIKEFFNYCADPDVRSASLTASYLRDNPEVLNALIGYLGTKLSAFETNSILGEQRELTGHQAAVNDAHRHLSGLREAATLNANFQRDMVRYVNTWQLGIDRNQRNR